MSANSVKIKDDYKLFEIMLNDEKFQNEIYKPGPYWLNKTKVAKNQIRKFGLSDFRESSSVIEPSFTDTLFIDMRKCWGGTFKLKLIKFVVEKVKPFSMLYDYQVNLTKFYAGSMLRFKQEVIKRHPRTQELLSKYKIPFSMLGCCMDYIEIDGNRISSHYLNLLEQFDRVAGKIDISKVKSIFEIGGGFGAHIHLLLTNYSNIKKVLYLDIPPNLYVGTQYLKAFFGEAVKDYNETRGFKEISFKDNDDLEIFAIAPWQIEKITAGIDILWNSHSFVEIPENIVAHYVKCIQGLPEHNSASIVLISYDQFDLKTTLDPDKLQKIFSMRQFNKYYFPSMIDNTRNNLYFISVGKK